MKNNFKAIIIIIIIAVLGVYIYFKINNDSQIIEDNSSVITDDKSLLGCYVAHLEKDIYTLNIQSSSDTEVTGILAYNNYQKDSSSGSFRGTFENGILLGKYSFDSEGLHSERQLIFKKVGNDLIQGFGPIKIIDGEEFFDSISSVTYDPKITFKKLDNCLEEFTDSNNIFSFKYNPFFKNIEWGNYLSTDWKVGSKEEGILLATVIIPRTYMQGTNFSDAKLTIGRSTTPNAIKNCTLIDETNGEVKDGTTMIGDYPFVKFNLSNAGAGNFYGTTSYRGIVDGDCYVIEYTIHSTNIDNYPLEQNIKKFDKIKIQNNLEEIIQSLIFNINSD